MAGAAAAPAPEMPTPALAARVYMRHVLEEACQRLLQRLVEGDSPEEEEGVQKCVAQMLRIVDIFSDAPDTPKVIRQMSETCACDQVPPDVLEVLAQGFLKGMKGWNHTGDNARESQRLIRELQRLILRQERLAAFFAEHWSQSLYREIKGLLGTKYWNRIRIQLGYDALFRAPEGDPEAQEPPGRDGTAGPEVQEPPGGDGTADPEVQEPPGGVHCSDSFQGSAAVPEVEACACPRAAGADPEAVRVDMALGDRKAEVGYYIQLKKNPKNRDALLSDRKTLRALLDAEHASAPGNVHTKEENRVCFQIIFYSAEELAKVSEQPEEMEKLLFQQSSWNHVMDCNLETWKLPKREVGVCILEVKPLF